tara:strand:- start:13 stop:387 length:375 start_codon:yes stop_codon:yes gene_type:complete
MAHGHDWDRETREFGIIEEVFKERFPNDYIFSNCRSGAASMLMGKSEQEAAQASFTQAEENLWQGFLAAWEFLRRITESNDSLLEELGKINPPKYVDPWGGLKTLEEIQESLNEDENNGPPMGL